MQKVCDWCKKSVRDVGKLSKVEYLMLCKKCRGKYKKVRKTKMKKRRL